MSVAAMGAFVLAAIRCPSTKRRTHWQASRHFLLSIPNGDHSFNRLNNKLELEYRDLLEHLKDKDPSYYYSDVLVPNGKTLKDFIGG